MSIAIPLGEQLAGRTIVTAPGVFDALSARLAADAGFETLYLSGASIAYTRLGRPDIGLVSMDEVAQILSTIRETVDRPIVVDADTGFGNAINVRRTVALFERMGASAIQLEDQSTPKRCGHLAGKELIAAGEMVGKIHAALDARHNADTLIVARTDAIAVEGFEAALERADRYVAAGANILFVEAPESVDQLAAIAARFKDRVPLMANMVEGGRTPMITAYALQKLGYSLAIFPGGTVRALAAAVRDYFESLRTHGTTRPFADRMLDFDQLNKLLHTEDLIALGRRYAGETEGDDGDD